MNLIHAIYDCQNRQERELTVKRKEECPLVDWVNDRSKLFIDDPENTELYQKLREWAKDGGYGDRAREDFFDCNCADPLLIITARIEGYVLVTRELPKARKKISIPDACKPLEVKYIDPFDMLERGVRFFFTLHRITRRSRSPSVV